ncbi:bifunctional 3-deoxy-7-phosphoheptulonate synthase/chorismate mutase type II [Mesonia aquimarina]|uniref:bifunctional 3-deoxy-7-phosphoheptulonate synthase/chorismate mutase type II n=1 Tax=Mesonia aquimarina TaxID=1504967 RepID=UPI000EF56F09|nr:bifunctional 3-deoxy-7-phosphoheptulonate synthase/chorismate mutase type II [Mesonia aquimarina]
MKNTTALKNWLTKFGNETPFLIAGPCSAETEEQVLKTAHQLKNTKAKVLRAGIWKPRTRPGNFEGVGALGLSWLQKAKQETGLLTATEVANPVHVDLALKHDVDILWIGARTTVSPFVVQEIAESLKGTDKTILIKNPVNPDLALWLGAVERFYKQDIENLGVIHRGFSSYGASKYRNIPEWQIPIDLQQQFPDLPLILDPSHISGDRKLIFELCQTALDLNYDGFMIETHPEPKKAWSDAAQQITPARLQEITEALTVRKKVSESKDFLEDLATLRLKIDRLDTTLIQALIKRMQVADEIGVLKRKQNVSLLQAERWAEILDKMIKAGNGNGLSEEFILRIFKAIHQESLEHQHKKIQE